jgi:hypothetical protein
MHRQGVRSHLGRQELLIRMYVRVNMSFSALLLKIVSFRITELLIRFS